MVGYVVVTGVSSGIGLSIAQALISHGYKVFGSVRREVDGQRAAEKLGAAFVPLVFDVTDTAAIAAAAQKVSEIVGERGLAGLINNAGISVAGPLMLLPLEEIRKTFDVNVLGVIAVTQAFLPLLRAPSGAGREPGRIVNIGSVSGTFAAPFMGAYAGSKHALEAVSQALRRELKIYGIEVSTIEPSFVKSEIFGKTVSMGFDATDYAKPWAIFTRSIADEEKTAASPNIVCKAVLDALTRKVPKTRYPLHPVWWIGRLLGDRQFDKIIFKKMGLEKALVRSV